MPGSFEENRKRSEFRCLALKWQGSFEESLEQSALKTFFCFSLLGSVCVCSCI